MTLLKIKCDTCGHVFYVEKYRGRRFSSKTNGVNMCPFCGSHILYIEEEVKC